MSIQSRVYNYVLNNPTSVAIQSSEGASISYSQLWFSAQHFRHVLMKLDVQPEEIVCVALDEGIDIVIVFLGILLAGGVFAPIDVNDNLSRQISILSESGMRFVITDKTYADSLQGLSLVLIEHPLFCHDHGEFPDCEPGDLGQCSEKDLALCYITSGSTGTPKGVLIEHAAVLNHLENHPLSMVAGGAQRKMLITSPCFHVPFSTDICNVLGNGHIVCFNNSKHCFPDPSSFPEIVLLMEISHLCITPSGLKYLGNHEATPMHISKKGHGTLECIILLGEPITPDLVEKWVSWVTLYNMYGSTECLGLWFRRFQEGDDLDLNVLTFLSKNVTTKIEKADESEFDVCEETSSSLGAGEILISGVQLPRAYTGSSGSDRFFYDAEGNRWFRTGDKGYLHVGDNGMKLVMLGRIDDFDTTRKVGASRLDCREIEMVLSQHPSVIACGAGWDQKNLFAMVVLKTEPTLEQLEGLLKLCKLQLPKFACPCIVPVEGLPQTRTGKLDRRALLAAWKQFEISFLGTSSKDIE